MSLYDDNGNPTVTPRPVVYYDGRRYLWENGKDYVPLDRQSLIAQLKRAGLDPHEETCEIQLKHYVKYAGPLAGRQRGLVKSNGDLLLATTAPEIIPALKMPWPTIRQFLENLLLDDDHGDEQLVRFMGWMKFARLALLEGKRRPGQALVLTGPIQCGKTTLIRLIVRGMGNRQAMPYKFLTDKTGFNQDIVGAEVQVIDDDTGTTHISSRRALGDGIKNKLFADAVRIEGKNRNAFTFDPLWRLVIACNDEPENLLVLPPLNRDLADKMMLLHCQPAIDCRDDDAWKEFNTAIEAELPGWLYACETMEIPDDIKDGRCGVAAFQHPLIVDALTELSPERHLLQLIDQLTAAGHLELPWEGIAADLRSKLTDLGSPCARDAEKLLRNWIPAVGVYLGRLVGDRVEKLTLYEGDQRWRVNPPGG